MCVRRVVCSLRFRVLSRVSHLSLSLSLLVLGMYSGDKLVDGKCYTCALEGYVVDQFVVDGEDVTCTCTTLCESDSCLTRAALLMPCIVAGGDGVAPGVGVHNE